MEKNENLEIFICTHKDFCKPVCSKVYKVINCKDIDYNTPSGLKDEFYSEIYTYLYLADKVELKDYVGLCHYRRYWGFMDEIPDMDEIFKKYDIIVPIPVNFGESVKKQYARGHNIEDLNIVTDILNKKFPSYANIWDSFLNGSLMISYNMMIVRKELFLDYVSFIKAMMEEYLKEVGKDIRKRVLDNKEKYLKSFSPLNEVEYQVRVGSFLIERLTNAWVIANCPKKKWMNVVRTEVKYKNIES